jgi:hypothetical protein
MKDWDKKMFTPPLATDSEFLIPPLPILVRYKTKGAAGAVLAFGH